MMAAKRERSEKCHGNINATHALTGMILPSFMKTHLNRMTMGIANRINKKQETAQQKTTRARIGNYILAWTKKVKGPND